MFKVKTLWFLSGKMSAISEVAIGV